MKRENKAKDKFLSSFPDLLVINRINEFKLNISFNFSYFDYSQGPSSSYKNLKHEQLIKYLEKLKYYSANNKSYWAQQKIGSHKNNVLEIYKDFPRKSEFVHPKNIPLDVWWARFRLESDFRLIGFFIPDEIASENCLNNNIFYIVFIDEKHKFYLQK
jgi:hypothetical protein